MDTQLLHNKFRRIDARLKVVPDAGVVRVKLDIGRDRKGEYFDLHVRRDLRVAADAIDVRPFDRHLLLAVRDEDRLGLPTGGAQRFLCGHDERAWFVAAVPEARAASNVREAMEALKPWPVRAAQNQARVPFDHRNRRHNAAFVRQGEWFFVPASGASVPPDAILRNEPLVRTGGKPHRAEFLHRAGGELVYVNPQTGRVLSMNRYEQFLRDMPGGLAGYRPQRRNMTVMVKGRISHPDHQSIVLRDWHAVYMNTEHQSEAMRVVAFMD